MATDVARLSFDPARRYTGVVPQQGRVGLEAEQNEQRGIDGEERRRELLEIVGPAGTPDNGYAVSSPAPGTLVVGPGTMYVGGVRVGLDAPLDVAHQRDWLDRPRDVALTGTEHVLLTLTECDVTAVEDSALYEVALGGPDGAARTRLLQHVEVVGTTGNSCATALAAGEQDWAADGLTFDPATMRLESQSRLQVTFQTPATPPDPCEPSATGGYLGAENQLLRVQTTGADAAAGTVDLVWGYDDASMLYRVTLDPASLDMVLDRRPVDDYHRPRAGQAVQLLRATAALASTDGQVEGYVAAPNGPVATLAEPFDPDTKTVHWPAPLPTEYTDPDQNPALYLRVWEQALQGRALGTPVDLGATGVQVTITLDGGTAAHTGDFWCIGVRPGTPTAVYPARLLRTPQPPEGPRQWVCPLAVVTWSPDDATMTLVEDCRHHFPPLVGLTGTGCCTLEVTPADASAGRLQAKLDAVAAGRLLADRAARITVCFAPGHYELTKPILLDAGHSRMTLQGCSRAAVLSARAGAESAFDQGLVVLTEADDVTITGLELRLPLVPQQAPQVRAVVGGVFGRDAIRAINALAASRYVSIGVRPVNCAVLEVSDCLFRFAVGSDSQPDADPKASVIAVGIFPGANVFGSRVLRNEFRHDPLVPLPDGGPQRILVGYLGTATALPGEAGNAPNAVGAAVQGNLVDDLDLTGNEFAGLALAALVSGQLGAVRICDNSVRDGYAGFFLEGSLGAARPRLTGTFEVHGADADAVAATGRALADALADEVVVLLTAFAGTYPLPPLPEGTEGRTRLDPKALPGLRASAGERQQASATELVERMAAEHPSRGTDTTRSDTGRSDTGRSDTGQSDTGRSDTGRSDTGRSVVLTAPPAVRRADRGLLAAADAVHELAALAALATAGTTVTWAAQFCRNDVECRLPGDAVTEPGLFVLGPRRGAGPGSSMVASDNRIIAPQAGTAASVVGLENATITGNVCIAGESDATSALTVAGVLRVAITGNVLHEFARLPAGRPFPAPLDGWDALNTIG